MKLVATLLTALVVAGPAAAIVGGTSTSDFRSVGDGVQFTASWVLTARHVGFRVGDAYVNGWGSAAVAALYDLPGPGYPQNDLTLLRLATPIAAAPVIAIEGTLLAAGPLATPVVTTIATNSNQSPRGRATTLLQEVLDRVDDNGTTYPVRWLRTYSNGMGAPYVESGDSGGGLFLGNVVDNTSPLLGITTALLTDNDANPTQFSSAFVQLAAYRNFIDSTMASDTADAQMATWVNALPVPEPSAAALLVAGLAALALRRRRSAQPPM